MAGPGQPHGPAPDHGETSYHGSGRLAGRKALLTGGDSSMGRAAAITFGRDGADVAINYLPAEEPDAREVVQLIRDAGRKAAALPGDIRDEAFFNKLVADAVGQLGGLDIVMSNAARQVARTRHSLRMSALQGAALTAGSVPEPANHRLGNRPSPRCREERLPGSNDGRPARQVMECASSVLSDTGPAASNVATV